MPKLQQYNRCLTEWVMQMAEEGKLVLGGCNISNLSPQWQCVQCKTRYIKT